MVCRDGIVPRERPRKCGLTGPQAYRPFSVGTTRPILRTGSRASVVNRSLPSRNLLPYRVHFRTDERIYEVIKKVIQLAIGVSGSGYREVLGIRVARQESETSWREFFTWLNKRGLAGVDYVTSDDHEGLKLALGKTLPHVVWQRCQTHFSRSLLDKVHKKDRQQVHGMLKYMYDAPTKEKALEAAEELMDFLEERYPEAMGILDNAKEDILAVYDLPVHCRKKVRTTNMTERTNEEIRRRERVIRIFPKDASALMLAGAYLQELSEEWISGRRYMDLAEFHEAKAEQEQKEKASVKQPVNMAQPEAVAVNM